MIKFVTKYLSKTVIKLIVPVLCLGIGIGVFWAGTKARVENYEKNLNAALTSAEIQTETKQQLLGKLNVLIKELDKQEYETIEEIIEVAQITDADFKEIKNVVDAVVDNYPELANMEEYQVLTNNLLSVEEKLDYVEANYENWLVYYKEFTSNPLRKFALKTLGYEVVEFEDTVKGD